MSGEIIHLTDCPDCEGKYHLACKKYWVTAIWTEPDKKKEGLCKCADGTYMTGDKEKVTCNDCKAKLN